MIAYEYDMILMSVLIFLPTIFALGLIFFPKNTDDWMRWWTLLGMTATLIVSLCVLSDYLKFPQDFYSNNANPEEREKTSLLYRSLADANRTESPKDSFQTIDWVGRSEWIPQFNIQYYLGLDGISITLIVLTTVIFFLSMIAAWSIEKHVKGFCILLLFLETGVLGCFMALDFFLFFVFWEVMLLPMYFLIGIWGGARREYAALKFFLYTMLGSVFILIAMLGFYFTDVSPYTAKAEGANAAVAQKDTKEASAEHTFDIMKLHSVGLQVRQEMQEEGYSEEGKALFFTTFGQYAFFLMLFVGFAIKVPVFPFHTWLPDAHVEAPTPISMILAGILLKLGGYGILHIAYPICPFAAESLAWWLALLGIINIVYGALAAMAQTDFKKLVAYSSVSHMGYVILGIAVWNVSQGSQFWAWGMNGAMFQMVAHGISSAGMFFMVGIIYERAHHRNLNNFRGLYEPMPLYGGISAIIFFAALGLPGLCGFVGEFFVVVATWNYDKAFAFLAALTVVITAAYILWTIQRVYMGVNPAYKDYKDITFRELLCAVPIVILAILLGVWPTLVMDWMEPSVTGLVETLSKSP